MTFMAHRRLSGSFAPAAFAAFAGFDANAEGGRCQ
jgi:hypothetical protein